MEPIDVRKNDLAVWLQGPLQSWPMGILPMPGDASSRRYFRILHDKVSYVVMDAAPELGHDVRPFIAIANALRAMGLLTPEIIAVDVARGFLLLSDFGASTYLHVLNDSNADFLYNQALDALAVLQRCCNVPEWVVPFFTRELMWQEWSWFQDWFVGRYLQLAPSSITKELHDCMQLVIECALSQPQVFMHRDYHSANLMLVKQSVGILDFQDAFIGPVTYDLVSLLRDCYISWSTEQVHAWVLSYHDRLQDTGIASVSAEVFLRWFDWMGVQRHLKALFTFSRKHIRDHMSQYLQHVPRTLQYLTQVSNAYPELTALSDFLQTQVVPAYQKVTAQCVA
ncbi:MAG: hypothetical protein A3E83_06125 [Gammaproteobacteria bacterium RIFCSPHIGHO2_12_FULL_41_20]|nr:MAG: hypothetical protein A3E83_06125 [Gammaproteobacteria bacterium RIFCSPHIGHO2_12_FULL_41_20]